MVGINGDLIISQLAEANWREGEELVYNNLYYKAGSM